MNNTTLIASYPHTPLCEPLCSRDSQSGILDTLLSASHPTFFLLVLSATTQPKLISPVAGI